MASATEVASVQDVVSVPDVASISNGTPVPYDSCASKGTSVPNGTSVPHDTCVSNGTPNPNGTSVQTGDSVSNGIPVSNGTSIPNGTLIPNGTSVLNGISATSPIPNGTPAISSVPDDPVTFPVADGTSTTSATPASLRIAIIGGGIGGISLALGLLKHPHIDFQIYEAAPIWVQIGAGLGLGPNAQAALEMIGPETEYAFRKNVTGNLWESHQKTFLNFFAVSLLSFFRILFPLYYSGRVLTNPPYDLGPRSERRSADSHPKMLHGIAILSQSPFRQRPH